MRSGLRGPGRGVIGVAHPPAQQGDDQGVDIRARLGSRSLNAVAQVIWRARRDRPVAVLARHVVNSRIVACHPSILRARVVASHLDQGEPPR